jgi:hypothetical protein
MEAAIAGERIGWRDVGQTFSLKGEAKSQVVLAA